MSDEIRKLSDVKLAVMIALGNWRTSDEDALALMVESGFTEEQTKDAIQWWHQENDEPAGLTV